MFTLTEAQAWTVIATLPVAVFGMMTLMSTMVIRVLRTEIGGLRTEMKALRGEMTTQFTAMGIRIDGVGRRLESVERKVEGLEGDVRTLFRRTFGGDGDDR
ncbi:hypothetical protein GCM10027568_25030 [Humibacter soli]